MARPKLEELEWYAPVAESMAREGLSFRESLDKHGVALTTKEYETYQKRREFQICLRTARNRYWRELANDPERSKATAVGMMIQSITKLSEQGEHEKVVDGVVKLARVEGWINGEGNINVFSGLSQAELDKVKEEFERRANQVAVPELPKPGDSALPN